MHNNLTSLYLILVMTLSLLVGVSCNAEQFSNKNELSGGESVEFWAIRVSLGTKPGFLVKDYKLESPKQIGSLKDTYLIKIINADLLAQLQADKRIIWMEKQISQQRFKRP